LTPLGCGGRIAGIAGMGSKVWTTGFRYSWKKTKAAAKDRAG